MISRFEGPEGRRRLIDALSEQRLVECDRALAGQIADKCRLRSIDKGQALIAQDEPDNDLYFILSGRVSIRINGHEVNQRAPRTHVGEMAAIDPSAKRSATVIALEDTLVAALPESDLTLIAESKPRVWRLMAIELAERLRQRSVFLRPPNPIPIVFIGSSREALPIAQAIKAAIPIGIAEVRIWTDGVFGASTFPMEALETQLLQADFAVLLAAKDDRVISRGKEADAPRDNIVFELGLFMGALGRKRTFLVVPEHVSLKHPSDILGLTPIRYNPDNPSETLPAMADELGTAFNRQGPRYLHFRPN